MDGNRYERQQDTWGKRTKRLPEVRFTPEELEQVKEAAVGYPTFSDFVRDRLIPKSKDETVQGLLRNAKAQQDDIQQTLAAIMRTLSK